MVLSYRQPWRILVLYWVFCCVDSLYDPSRLDTGFSSSYETNINPFTVIKSLENDQ